MVIKFGAANCFTCASLKWSSPESRLPGPDEVKKSTPGVEDLNMEADTELGGATEPPPAV